MRFFLDFWGQVWGPVPFLLVLITLFFGGVAAGVSIRCVIFKYIRPDSYDSVALIRWSITTIICLITGLFFFDDAKQKCINFYSSPEEYLAWEQAQLAEEKREQAVKRAQTLKSAQMRVKLAKIQAERAKLRNEPTPNSISFELVKAQEELARLKSGGVDYSKLSEPQMSSAPLAPARAPQTPVDDQTKLILSALWLGACFFLQRVFEKLFKDKGYALLTVCAAGFLLAFFTANYFLLGGSVTGGLMGSVGDRG